MRTTSVTREGYVPPHEGECMVVALRMIDYDRRRVLCAVQIYAEIADLAMVNEVGEFLLTEAAFTVSVARSPLKAKLEGMVRVARVVNILR